MSMELMVKAMKIKVGNPLRKLVLLKLADNASDLGECWPSHQHIADQCEISKRSVIEHIKALVDMKLLRVENRVKNNEKQSNVYYLTLDKKSSAGNSLPSATDSQGGAGDSLPSSAGDAHRISHSFEPVNEPISIGAKSTSTKFNALTELINLGVDEQHAKDWLSSRKKKLTQTALNALVRECGKGNTSVARAVEACAERGWESYQSHYNLGESLGGNHESNSGRKLSAHERVRQANDRSREQRTTQG